MSEWTDDDRAEHHQAMLEREQATLQALRVAASHGTPEEALMTLAYEAGVATTFYKELKNETHR